MTPQTTKLLLAAGALVVAGVVGSLVVMRDTEETPSSTETAAVNTPAAETPATQPAATEQDVAAPEATDAASEKTEPQSMFDAMRESVPLLKEYSDERIMQDMEAMPDVNVYLSDKAMIGKVGILALGHGYREHGNADFEAAMKPIAEEFPTAVGYGMAMHFSGHLQRAADELVAAGAETIVVLPFTSTPGGRMERQWDYIFGRLDEPGYLEVPKVKTTAQVLFAEFPEDDPILSTIMLDFAREKSTDPKNEIVILVVHGPTSNELNQEELAVMDEHAARIKAQSDFSDVRAFSIQDDSPTENRTANVNRLRAMIEAAKADGKKVIIVTKLIMSDQFLHKKLREKDLVGLDFEMTTKGLTAHPAFAKWVDDAIAAKLAMAKPQN